MIACIVFTIFAIKGRSFIWQADGLKQHYIILKDFHENMRAFLTNFSKGFDCFSWNMGLGLDVIGQYSYYVLGDPFAYFSLLFPVQALEKVYTFLILLRFYCIGFSFLVYAQYHQQRSFNALLGAIIYTFSGYALFAGVRHPYFLNAIILFPLLLLAVDKLLEENKKVPFAIAVAISAISNYYFFYMHTIMIVLYAIICYCCHYRKEGWNHCFKKVGSAFLSYLVGILIASIILLPTVYAFFNSARSGEETICQYALDYYKSLFSINLLSVYGENWSYIGVSSIILLMLPILWKRRKTHQVYFIYWLITTMMLLIPFLGSMMNGFSFPNNRWSFMYSFILAYIVTLCFDKQYTKNEMKTMGICLALYSFVAILAVLSIKAMSCFVIYLIEILIAFFLLMLILNYNYQEEKKELPHQILQWFQKNQFIISIMCFVILGIGIMAYGLYSSYDKNYAKQFIRMEGCQENLATQLGNNKNYAKNIQNIIAQDNSFYRIAKAPHQIQNLSIYYGYASTECFLSLGNQYVYRLNQELADNNYSTTSSIRGLGDRTKATTLLGTKYYVVDEKNERYVPYGYSLVEEIDGVKTYQNNYPLSVGITYSSYLPRNQYEALSPTQKEEAMLRYAVIDDEEKVKNFNLKKVTNLEEMKRVEQNIPYELIDEENIVKSNQIVTNKSNQTIFLQIPPITNAELYVFVSGFEFLGSSKHIITASFEEKSISKTVDNKLTSAYYQKSPEVLLNLGYYEKAEGKIALKFSAKGTYQFKNIQVIAVSMDHYAKLIQNLQQNELKNITVNNRKIEGSLNLDNDSILQISTSFTKGWKAYVDEVPVQTLKVNAAFIGIPVKAGEHAIKLEYETPYLKLGMACTIVGLVLLEIIILQEKNRGKK